VLTVAPWARDVSAITTQPGVVRVTVLRSGSDSIPTEAERETIRLHLRDEAIRPLTDVVQVLPPSVRHATIEARLTLYPGPDAGVVQSRATAALGDWLERNRMLGMNLRRSAIFAKLHQEGVQSVELTAPAEDIVLDETEVYAIVGMAITTASTRDT
jgi:phage-related baseplate assembly protein